MCRSSVLQALVSSALCFGAVSFAPAQTWTLTSAPLTNWSAITSSADGAHLVAATSGYSSWPAPPPQERVVSGLMCASDNSGVSWQPILGTNRLFGPCNQGWHSIVSSADGTKLFAAGHAIGDIPEKLPLCSSPDAGATWTNTYPFADYWEGLAVSADGTCLAAVSFEGLPDGRNCYISRNSGATWEWASKQRVSHVVWAANGKVLLVAGPNWIACSTNSGVTWGPARLFSVTWSALAASADGNMLIAAASRVHEPTPSSPGSIYTSRDFGHTWTASGAPGKYWQTVATSGDGTRLVATADYQEGGPIFISSDSGATWSTNGSPWGHWRGVASSADGCKLAVVDMGAPGFGWGEGGQIYTWQTTPQPRLSATFSPNTLTLSWLVPCSSFVLQQSSTLTPAAWTTVTAPLTLNYHNLRYEVSLPKLEGAVFYRLVSQ